LSVMGADNKEVNSSAPRYQERSERILLAEDVTVNQQVAIGMLKRLGLVHIDIANNGNEAVQRFTCGKYALILMDLQMPGMDGYTATKQIREMEKAAGTKSHTPIIALTAHALSEEKTRCYHKGIDDLITKPLTGEKLATAIRHWLPESSNTPQTEDDLPALDRAVLQRLHDDMGGSIDPILTAFINELPQQIDALCLTLQSEDHEALQHLAHRLKGSCRNIGALALGDICTQLEQQANRQKAIDRTATTKLLQHELQRLTTALNASWVAELR